MRPISNNMGDIISASYMEPAILQSGKAIASIARIGLNIHAQVISADFSPILQPSLKLIQLQHLRQHRKAQGIVSDEELNDLSLLKIKYGNFNVIQNFGLPDKSMLVSTPIARKVTAHVILGLTNKILPHNPIIVAFDGQRVINY
jgi:hypothetical protein